MSEKELSFFLGKIRAFVQDRENPPECLEIEHLQNSEEIKRRMIIFLEKIGVNIPFFLTNDSSDMNYLGNIVRGNPHHSLKNYAENPLILYEEIRAQIGNLGRKMH